MVVFNAHDGREYRLAPDAGNLGTSPLLVWICPL